MRHLCASLLLIGTSVPAHAEIVPQPDIENPRLQTVQWVEGEEVVLTALPMTNLTVMLDPAEAIERVTLDRRGSFEVGVSAERNALSIMPRVEDAASILTVATDLRNYRFRLQTGNGLLAAYVVQFGYDSDAVPVFTEAPQETAPTGLTWRYRVRGDRSVRPAQISDNGVRTRIEFAQDQPLPGVFAIGATGDEQVVNGHMRNGVYEIDRIWEELIFRIDKKKATAERNDRAEESDG